MLTLYYSKQMIRTFFCNYVIKNVSKLLKKNKNTTEISSMVAGRDVVVGLITDEAKKKKKKNL